MKSDHWLSLWIFGIFGFALSNYQSQEMISLSFLIFTLISSVFHAITSTKEMYNN